MGKNVNRHFSRNFDAFDIFLIKITDLHANIHLHTSLADRCKNCGIYGKSTKFGTKIENYLLNNIRYGPTWDLSHNCNYNELLHLKHGNEAV